MKKNKTFISAILSLCLIFMCVTPSFSAERPISVYLDGKLVEFDFTNGKRDQALTIHDYAYVPIARIVEILTGTRPVWDNYARTSTFTYNSKKYIIDTNRNGIYVDGVFVNSVTGTPPVIVNDRMMIPLKMLSSTMGFGQNYDAATHSTWLISPVKTILTPTPTPTPTPAPAVTQPVINSSSLSKSSITLNEQVVLTVKTNSAVNYVWASYDGASAAAAYQSTDSSGVKTWKLNLNPVKTQNITVFANTASQSVTGAASQLVNVTVNAPVSAINNVSASKTSIAANENVTLTVKTNSVVNYVWVYYDGASVNASLQSTDSAGVKTWTVTVRPSKSQSMTVYANATQSSADAAAKEFSVTVEEYIKIISTNANKNAITEGDFVTLTIKTNSAVNYVWANLGAQSAQFSYSGTDSSGIKTWTYLYYPQQSHTAVIYASAASSTGRDASDSVYITVGQRAEPPIIFGTTPDANTYYYINGDKITVSVTTNTSVDYVVFSGTNVTGGGTVQAYSTGAGTRIWSCSFTAKLDLNIVNSFAEISVTAYNNLGQSASDSIAVTVYNP